MVPGIVEPSRRALRRKRFERVALGINGATFRIAAWDGLDTQGPLGLVALDAVLGLVQLAALLRRRTGLPYAFAFVALLDVALACVGPEGLRRLMRRGR